MPATTAICDGAPVPVVHRGHDGVASPVARWSTPVRYISVRLLNEGTPLGVDWNQQRGFVLLVMPGSAVVPPTLPSLSMKAKPLSR